jgi:hypothetical protein
MILTPNERTKSLLDALDTYLMDSWEDIPLSDLKTALECRDILLDQLEQQDCACFSDESWDSTADDSRNVQICGCDACMSDGPD